MTFSIVARSDDGHAHGVAVASKSLAVGRYVPALRAGIGAVATQGDANLTFRTRGLALLAARMPAAAIAEELTARDPRPSVRQLAIVDAQGGSATHTGSDCLEWAGGVCGPGFAVQGNLLTGPEVVEAMVTAWSHGSGSLAHRLAMALQAGDRAGGDRRGRRSAAVVVVSPAAGGSVGDDIEVDLRVDSGADPVNDLIHLLQEHELTAMPPLDRDKVDVTPALRARLNVFAAGEGCADFYAWAGIHNREMRVDPDLTWVDRGLLALAGIGS